MRPLLNSVCLGHRCYLLILGTELERQFKETENLTLYFTIRGGSLKKMAKKIIPNVPTNKKV